MSQLPSHLASGLKLRGWRVIPAASLSVQINYCPLIRGKVKVSLIRGIKYFLENIHPIHLVRRLENHGRVKIKLVMRKGAFI